ncbi:MAG TPA: rhodanese-like domain-containing protein [Flavobacteriaceae bacterium]|nr:rhodanese-like domain-containing protein [Flavobacteriaceae bacterium]
MTDLSPQEWQSRLNSDPNGVVLDVRTAAETAEGIIPEALQIDIYSGAAFLEQVKQLDKTKHYYVYCRSGARSAQACIVLEQLGVARTYNLAGGILEWRGPLVNPK